MNEKLSYNEAIALGLTELYRRRDEMADTGEIDPSNWNTIQNAISHLESQQANEQAAEERQQKQAEQIDKLLAEIQETNPFGKMFPKETFEELFGPNEYTVMQQQLHQFIYGCIVDGQKSLEKLYKDELDQKNEQIRKLTNEIKVAENQIAEFIDQLATSNTNLQLAKEELKEVYRENKQLKDEVRVKGEEIAKLSDKLKDRDEPNVDTEGGIQERAGSLKPFDVDAMIARFNSRQKEDEHKVPIAIPTFGGEPEGASFREETTESESGNSGVSATETTEVTFQESTDSSSFGLSESAETDDRGMGTVTREEFEAALKRIDRLEERANINREVA